MNTRLRFVGPDREEVVLALPPGHHDIPMTLIKLEVVCSGETTTMVLTYMLTQEYTDKMRREMDRAAAASNA